MIGHFRIDDSQLKAYEHDLARLRRKSLPYATKQAVNDLAFQARREWQHEIGETFTIRNKWTQGSIQVDPTRSSRISDQAAVVGSKADYMATQEQGGVIRGQGEGKAIPTTDARIGKSNAKLVRKPNRQANINLTRRGRGSERQRNAMQIASAKKRSSGGKFAYLEKGRKRGIFKVGGGKRSVRLTLIQNLTEPSVTITPKPTMRHAVRKALRFAPRAYRTALTFQLHRLKTYR